MVIKEVINEAAPEALLCDYEEHKRKKLAADKKDKTCGLIPVCISALIILISIAITQIFPIVPAIIVSVAVVGVFMVPMVLLHSKDKKRFDEFLKELELLRCSSHAQGWREVFEFIDDHDDLHLLNFGAKLVLIFEREPVRYMELVAGTHTLTIVLANEHGDDVTDVIPIEYDEECCTAREGTIVIHEDFSVDVSPIRVESDTPVYRYRA